ncbi:MAG: ROK family protein [Phycisphaeraceae bacterium]|nr:ROK family protein [Phycisphaeraceae bacterium]
MAAESTPKRKGLYVGVDLGGTNIQTGVVDSDGRVLSRDKRKTKAELDGDAIVGRVVDSVNEAMHLAEVNSKAVTAIGVGAPGAIDERTGVVLRAPNLRWTNYPLAAKLRSALDHPVVVDNDVNVGAWGEYLVGAGRKLKVRDMMAVFVGTGVGGGLILDGRVYRGGRGTAGEIGHVILFPGMPEGRRTVENFASRTAMANLLRELIQAGRKSQLPELTGGDLAQIRSKVLKQAVGAGDALTIQTLKFVAGYLGIAIANTVTMLSLSAVVVGGGVTEALGKPFVEWVRSGFLEAVFPDELRDVSIVAGTLGDDSGVVGAALMARDMVLPD